MGKRSTFARIDKDRYDTIDRRAVMALLPFVAPKTVFAEPCCGERKLLLDLIILGKLLGGYQGDILTGQDALKLTSQDLKDVDMIITNPPWTRSILHPMIQLFSSLKPTWLLFDSDWAYTRQSAPYMALCTDIVAVGRLIWMPGTKTSGKDNCSWYRFSADANGTTFHGRS